MQRSNSFIPTPLVPIPFEVETLNVGGAMNLKSGIFTAPRPGAYFFSFTGMGNAHVRFSLYVNDSSIGSGYAPSGYQTFSFQSTIQLNIGDKVSVRIGYGMLYEEIANRYTHFTGMFLQEDLTEI